MEPEQLELENVIYLEALRKNNVYKEYLLSLYNGLDDSLDDCIPFSLKEIIDIIINLNYQAKKFKRSQILPILISSDLEKEDLYNSIKARFQNQKLVYIPLCPIDVRIYYHIYSCLIEELGLEGYGIYWVLVEKLREEKEYKCSLKMIPFFT